MLYNVSSFHAGRPCRVNRSRAWRLAVHPRVAEALQGPESDMLTELEHRLERQITLESREDFHLEHFEFGSPDGAARQQSA